PASGGRFMPPALRRWTSLLALLLAVSLASSARAQMTPDQAAAMLLAGARRAYNDRNYNFAADQFRQFLARFGGHKEANSARLGLALCLIEGPRDHDKALEQLNPMLGDKGWSEHAFVQYYAGLCRRAQGVKALDNAIKKPAEAAGHNN